MKNWNLKVIVCGLFLLLLLSACATAPLATSSADMQAKQFLSNPNKSVIYLYRDSIVGSAVKPDISLDGKYKGWIDTGTYFMWIVDPGVHTIVSQSGNENTDKVSLNTQPGQLYYVRQMMEMGMWQAKTNIEEVDAKTAKMAIIDSSLLSDKFPQKRVEARSAGVMDGTIVVTDSNGEPIDDAGLGDDKNRFTTIRGTMKEEE